MPNEYDRFGRGRTLEQYKQEELEAVERLQDESEVEQERKRLVYLSLMLEAESQGNPHGLAEFNKERFDRISTIIKARHRGQRIRTSASFWFSFVAVIVSLVAVIVSLYTLLYKE